MRQAQPSQVVSIGECMVELARGSDGRFGLAFGGDTFNTALYMARSGARVAYATRLGLDPYSCAIVALAESEGIATHLMQRADGRMPGLYLIETTAGGERTFHYWRDRSPARELFDGPESATVADAMRAAQLVYLSGITLSLYSAAALDRFGAAIEAARAAGVRIAMDGNYRPRGWGGDLPRAQRVMARFWRLADVALPTFDDEAMLWGDATPGETIARLAALGPKEIVVKQGEQGAIVFAGQVPCHVPIPQRVAAIDTSAAGDSFNGAYLAARLAGIEPEVASLDGHRLAGVVVQHRGAIAPADATTPVIVKRGS
ncbi:MAG: sugar kinase [Hyphomicrobiaceae bacterium]